MSKNCLALGCSNKAEYNRIYCADCLRKLDEVNAIEELKDEVWKKVFALTVDIEYAKGYEKKFLLGKFEAFKEVWELLGGEVQEENI